MTAPAKVTSGRVALVTGASSGSWYHATKFAVEGLSESLRAEVAAFGIR
jgi:NAD(P)-dependent dehydrogenase (short-subunit alcohol dehydrogenase family)